MVGCLPHCGWLPQTCHGSGVEVKIRPLGPGMVQQIQQRCSTCGGGGYHCPPSDRWVLGALGGGWAGGRGGWRSQGPAWWAVPGKAAGRGSPCVTCRLRPAKREAERAAALLCPAPPRRCPKCEGKGLAPDRKVFEVHIEQGHRHGSKIVFRGEAGSDSPEVRGGEARGKGRHACCAGPAWCACGAGPAWHPQQPYLAGPDTPALAAAAQIG